jgi:hypothetical protein
MSTPEQLNGFYDVARTGHAPHLKFVSNPRPLPVVLSNGEDDLWRTDAQPGGRYRSIVQREGRWSYDAEFEITGDGGALESYAPDDAQVVALLVDRRVR